MRVVVIEQSKSVNHLFLIDNLDIVLEYCKEDITADELQRQLMDIHLTLKKRGVRASVEHYRRSPMGKQERYSIGMDEV